MRQKILYEAQTSSLRSFYFPSALFDWYKFTFHLETLRSVYLSESVALRTILGG